MPPLPRQNESAARWTITTGSWSGTGRDRVYRLPTVKGPKVDGEVEVIPATGRDFWRSLCEQVDAHYGASLDHQPPYVARIRQALRHEDGA